jgi:hypothetical protein
MIHAGCDMVLRGWMYKISRLNADPCVLLNDKEVMRCSAAALYIKFSIKMIPCCAGYPVTSLLY